MANGSEPAPGSNEVSVSNQRSVSKNIRKTSYRFPSPKPGVMTGKRAKISKGPAKKIMTKED